LGPPSSCPCFELQHQGRSLTEWERDCLSAYDLCFYCKRSTSHVARFCPSRLPPWSFFDDPCHIHHVWYHGSCICFYLALVHDTAPVLYGSILFTTALVWYGSWYGSCFIWFLSPVILVQCLILLTFDLIPLCLWGRMLHT
jgi:hypothetical protein